MTLTHKDIVAVIVLYTGEKKLTSISLEKLKESKIKTYVYDNSPESTILVNIETNDLESVVYKHDPRNHGLATAYNWVLSKEFEKKWILLLDQDTILEDRYFEELWTVRNPEIYDAILPLIRDKTSEVIISPLQYIYGNRSKPINNLDQFKGNIRAINSGSLLRIKTLKKINYFDQAFPLDYLDHITYYRLNQLKSKYLILNSELKHELSVTNISNDYPINRLKSILKSERKFHRIEGKYSLLFFYFRQAKILAGYLIRGRFRLFIITLRSLF